MTSSMTAKIDNNSSTGNVGDANPGDSSIVPKMEKRTERVDNFLTRTFSTLNAHRGET